MNYRKNPSLTAFQKRNLVWFFVASRIWAGPIEINCELGDLLDYEIHNLAHKYQISVAELAQMKRTARTITAKSFGAIQA